MENLALPLCSLCRKRWRHFSLFAKHLPREPAFTQIDAGYIACEIVIGNACCADQLLCKSISVTSGAKSSWDCDTLSYFLAEHSKDCSNTFVPSF